MKLQACSPRPGALDSCTVGNWPLGGLFLGRRQMSLSLMLLGLMLLCGCQGADNSNSANSPTGQAGAGPEGAPLERVTLMLNWYPEAEHGGFYAAKVHGIFEKNGLDVEIRPGGEKAPVAQELVTGRVQFAIGNADDVLQFREQSVDVVSLLAPIQQTPRCIMVRADSGIDSLGKLKGLTLQANKGQAFLSFMDKLGMLEGVQVVPYAGSVAQFVADKNFAIQAYNFSEPQLAEQEGVKVRTLMLSEIDFNPYASCLLAMSDTVKQKPELAKRMVDACREGWQKYLESPAETNAAILKANPERMTKEALEFGARELKPLCVSADSATASPADFGKSSLERWQKLVDQFIELKLITAEKVQASACFVELK
ncbi:MAG: ABC transporter substrate-binding protein [Pirellulaceae bacterium]|nr:ABC transporter substrate-binding protein [Pirellulaceae bacterium]